ncbi:MAG: hypothetical protein ACSLEL_05535 [Candidatus Malihini olakiniferum]
MFRCFAGTRANLPVLHSDAVSSAPLMNKRNKVDAGRWRDERAFKLSIATGNLLPIVSVSLVRGQNNVQDV